MPRFLVLLWFLAAGVATTVAPAPAYAQQQPEPATKGTEADEVESAETPTGPLIVSYKLAGRLQDSKPRLRAILDPLLAQGATWGTTERKEIEQFLHDKLGYRVTKLLTQSTARGVKLTLKLRPVSVIRHVRVHNTGSLRADDVRATMSVRKGMQITDNKKARARLFRKEEAAILDYLRDEGYLSGRATVSAAQDADESSATIHVNLHTGPAYKVGQITVVGNVSVPDRDIQNKIRQTWFFGLKQERPSRKNHSKALKAVAEMYKEAGFLAVKVTSDYADALNRAYEKTRRIDLVITIQEHKRVDVTFEGNRSIRDSQLREVLTLAREESYDDEELKNSADAIRHEYQRRGYFQAVVTFERSGVKNYERITFFIDEAPRMGVHEVRVSGNQAITTETLLGLINTKRMPGQVARIFQSGGYVTAQQLRNDQKNIEDLYKSRGFTNVLVEARIAPTRELLTESGALAAVVAADQTRRLFVEFAITEGAPQTVRLVDFAGNKKIPDFELQKRIVLKRGAAFTRKDMDEDVLRLARAYASRGLPSTAIKAEQSSEDGIFITVKYTITEGQPVRYGEILIRGNFRTNDWVVRDNLRFKTGQLMTLDSYEDSRQALRATGLFVAPRLERVSVGDNDSVQHVVVHVKEAHDNSGTLDLGGGLATDQTLFGNLKYRHKSLGGIGLNLLIEGEAGLQKQFADANLTIPIWFMKKYLYTPFYLGLSASVANEQHDRFGQLFSTELRATFSRELSIYSRLSFGYRFRTFNRTEELIRPSGPFSPVGGPLEKTQVRSTSASIGPTISYSRLTDAKGFANPLTASRGYKLIASMQLAHKSLLGESNFFKLSTSALFYIPLGDRVTITNGIRYDHGLPLGGAVLLPEVERFFAGGDTTFRGVARDHMKTEVVRSPIFPGSDAMEYRVIPVGGNIRFLHNLDIEFRLWDDSFLGVPMASGIFFDSGLVTNSLDPDSFQLRDFRHSIGVALLRVVTPFGTLSFEYAVPLDPKVGDDPKGRFHFNLNFVFG